MKHLLLLLFISTVGLVTNAQIYIGYTEREVINHLQNSEVTQRDSTEDGEISIAVMFKDQESMYVRRYYFDSRTGKCIRYVLEPVNQAALIDFVKYCNQNYVTTGTRTWRTYQNGDNIRVTMRYEKPIMKNLFYFLIDK